MKQREHAGITFFEFKELGGNSQVQHAIFGRKGGVSPAPFASLNLSVSVADQKANVYANRARAYGIYGRDTDSVVHAHLVHGTAVAAVSQANNGTWIEHVDGLITNQPGCALTMNFADCTPILLYDAHHRAIGLGHAGWQGAIKDLPGALVQAMQTHFGTNPAHLWAGIGPCIGPCCYEVGEPVISAINQAFDNPQELLIWPMERRLFSLKSNRALL